MRLKKWQLITLMTLAILALAVLGIGFVIVVKSTVPITTPVAVVVIPTLTVVPG
jgi:hypothetical protein